MLHRSISRALLATALLLGCLTGMAMPARADTRGPLVLAAAALSDSCMLAAADAWAAKGHPRPVLSLAASSALARQIEAGAPADLFISADEDWMNDVAAKGLLRPATRADLVGNALVLIAPASSTLRLRIAPNFPLAQALGQGRLATGNPDAVPAGKYAKAALGALGVWPSVADRIAAADNVRAALALVARGEAPLGIVYATDAKSEPKVRVVGIFPEITHLPILYPVATLTAATNPDTDAFRAFLLSREGKAIFRRFGFSAR
jgi:molybdate transport system substrate-binding protein